MAPQRKASKGVKLVVESMATARTRTPRRQKESEGVQQVEKNRNVRRRRTSAAAPGTSSSLDAEMIKHITREVTDTIKAHVDDRLDKIVSTLQHMHQPFVNPSPGTSTSQQRNHEVLDQAVEMATSALVGDTLIGLVGAQTETAVHVIRALHFIWVH